MYTLGNRAGYVAYRREVGEANRHLRQAARLVEAAGVRARDDEDP